MSTPRRRHESGYRRPSAAASGARIPPRPPGRVTGSGLDAPDRLVHREDGKSSDALVGWGHRATFDRLPPPRPRRRPRNLRRPGLRLLAKSTTRRTGRSHGRPSGCGRTPVRCGPSRWSPSPPPARSGTHTRRRVDLVQTHHSALTGPQAPQWTGREGRQSATDLDPPPFAR